MEKIDHKTEEFFAGLEHRAEAVFKNLESNGNTVFAKFERRMTKALNTFWIVLAATIVFGVAFMIDTSVAISNKANAADMIDYTKSTDVIDALKLDYMRSKDCFVIKDTSMIKFYEERYSWQLETILNKRK